jgi:hypothetical protein
MRVVLLLFASACVLSSQALDQLKLHNVKAEAVTYKGKPAIHITPTPAAQAETLAVVTAPGFQLEDGVIEVDLAGAPAPGSIDAARGFIGIAFRVRAAIDQFELFYIRPTNGRAEDQLRRNHSTQYVSFPDWPWQRTRQETPGLYESYVDLEPAVWTRVRIVVQGAKARLYVNGADQPCLIVNDLKLAPVKGAVALWVGPGTDGYFANMRVK